MATKKPAAQKPLDPLAIRMKLGLNQSAFWGRIQVTQSGGSRYESGSSMPRPVQMLLTIAYGTEAQASKAVAALRNS